MPAYWKDRAVNTVILYITGLDPEGEQIALLADKAFEDALITQDRVGGNGTIELDLDEPMNEAQLRLLMSLVEWKSAARVVAVGPSPLVNAADVALRIGRTRQSITQLASGARGPGGWPTPVNPGAGASLWEWGDVARWLNLHLGCDIPQPEIAAADLVSYANTLLRIANSVYTPEGNEPLREQARASLLVA